MKTLETIRVALKFRIDDEIIKIEKDTLLSVFGAMTPWPTGPFDIVNAVCTRNDKGEAKGVHNWKQVQNQAVYVKSDSVDEVNTVVADLVKHKASAIFLHVRPTKNDHQIPMFIFNHDEQTQLEKFVKKAQVELHKLITHPFDGIEVVPNESPRQTYKAQVEMTLQHSDSQGRKFENVSKSIVHIPYDVDISKLICKNIDVVSVSPRNGVLTFPQKAKDKFVFLLNRCDDDIMQLSCDIQKHGGHGLIVQGNTSLYHGVPIYAINKMQFEDLKEHDTRISVTLKRLEETENEHVSESEYMNGTESTDSMPDVSATTTVGKKFFSATKSLIGTVSSTVSSRFSFSSSAVKQPMKDLLKEWNMAEDGLNSFVKASNILNEKGLQNESEMVEIYKCLDQHLVLCNHKVHITLLAFIASFYISYEEKCSTKPKPLVREMAQKCVLNLDVTYSPTFQVFQQSEADPVRISLIASINKMIEKLGASKTKVQADYKTLLSNLLHILRSVSGDSVDIKILIPLVDPSSFFDLRHHFLSNVLEPNQLYSLALISQRSLEEMFECHGIIRATTAEGSESENIQLQPVVTHHLQNLISRQPFAKISDATCHAVIQFLNVHRIKTAVHSALLKKFAFTYYDARWDFKKLVTFWAMVDVEDSHYLHYKRIVTTALKEYMSNDSSRVPLFPSPIGHLLLSLDLMDSTLDCIAKFMRSNQSLLNKLLLIDAYWAEVDELHTFDSDIIEHNILHFISSALRSPVKSLWKEVFEIASLIPSLFSKRNTSQNTLLCEKIAKSVIAKASDDDVFARINDLALPVTEIPKFMFYLQLELSKYLRYSCGDIVLATKWFRHYQKLHSEKSGIMILLRDVLENAIEKWTPLNLLHVMRLEGLILDTLVQFCENTNNDIFRSIQQKLLKLGETWSTSFDENGIIVADIDEMISMYNDDKWKNFESFTGLPLPTKDDLIDTKVFTEKLLLSIQELYCFDFQEFPSMTTILDVLHWYDCDRSDDTILFKSIEYADRICEAPCEIDSMLQIVLNQRYTVFDIVAVEKSLSNFLKSYSQETLAAHYFHAHGSVVFKNHIGLGSWTSITIEDFMDRLEKTKTYLSRFIRCEIDNLFPSLINFVDNKSITWKGEVKVISYCPIFGFNEDDIDRFFAVVSAIEVSRVLDSFVQCCKSLDFCFVVSSEFQELELLASSSDKATWTNADVLGYSTELKCILTENHLTSDTDNIKEWLAKELEVLSCVANISKYMKFWGFVREMNWFGEEGIKQFYDEYGNVTNFLLFSNSESFEHVVLDALEPSVRFLASLGGHLSEPCLKNFNSSIRSFLSEKDLTRIEENLMFCFQNLTSIRGWFTDGLDEMAVAFKRFDSVWASGEYEIASDLILRFNGDTEEGTLSGASLSEFIQHLGFIQRDNDNVSDQIGHFLDNYHLLLKLAKNRKLITDIGFKEISNMDVIRIRADSGPGPIHRYLDSIQSIFHQSLNWLEGLYCKYPLLLIFSKSDMNVLYRRLLDYCGYEQNALESITSSLSALIPQTKLQRHAHEAINITKKCFDEWDSTNDDWLDAVGAFVTDWHENIGGHRLVSITKGVTLHSFDCNELSKAFINFALVQNIFKDRAPENFEVLDCTIGLRKENLSHFLRRVQGISYGNFIIMNIQDLNGEQQEVLAEFLSTPKIFENCTLNLVQLSDTIIHASPWVEQKVWNNKSLMKLDLHLKMSQIIDKDVFERLSVVSSSTSGSGKSHLIQAEMTKLRAKNQNVKTLCIPIHEQTTLTRIIDTLNRHQPSSNCLLAVHFSFMIDVNSGQESFINALNYFFNSLLLTQSVEDPVSGSSFRIGWARISIFVELQGDLSSLRNHIPILYYSATFLEPPQVYEIDHKARRVGLYLRAYQDGTIDRKFEQAEVKCIIFMIDMSGSMEGWPFEVAIQNALAIFDSHVHVGDEFGFVLFDHTTSFRIPLQTIQSDEHRYQLRTILADSQMSRGGTSMYDSLYRVFSLLTRADCSSWIVCLTDGVSDNKSEPDFQRLLLASAESVHLMIIGVNLHQGYAEKLRNICLKHGQMATQGFFVSCENNIDAVNRAFGDVAAMIPVSQTFELDGVLDDEKCRELILHYIPCHVKRSEMIRIKFWIEFLYRRVLIFDQNEDFNYNETFDNLGSSLMNIMLFEAERLLCVDHSTAWSESNHEQLIYDFSEQTPKFRLICTAPDAMSAESIQKYESLHLPGFSIPKSEDLFKRETLDRYLSQALHIPLTKDADGTFRLSCVDDNKFVLTLDFTMKLLNMHERVACNIPCIIEGETGVSKTALTKMYSILRNSSLSVHDTRIENHGFKVKTFFELNVDASLSEEDISSFFETVRDAAQKLAPSGAVVVVFLDEINTSSVMGLFKEIVIDRSLSGKPLEQNIVIIAACNPSGRKSLSSGLRVDLANEWSSGHYQVHHLPRSMETVKWQYGSLTSNQEKDFIRRRIELVENCSIPDFMKRQLTILVASSQEIIRSLAAKNIELGLKRINYSGNVVTEAMNRSRSAVSLRDIQRVFHLYHFFSKDFPLTKGDGQINSVECMLLTIAVVYYLKLDKMSREFFLERLDVAEGIQELSEKFTSTLDNMMTKILVETALPESIALTQGIKENVFMTIICTLSSVPLIIIGPPGTSKTLAVNVVDQNANGEESMSDLYSILPRISTFHYQCSRRSTSKEIASVFDKAIQRQSKVEASKNKCLVFMDEAGLPEEAKESLKVLHYYLEGHMSKKADVSFVAITNHVLDAAKSNRCVSLLRQEPDDEEMFRIAEGILFENNNYEVLGSPDLVRLDETISLSKAELCQKCCISYKQILQYDQGRFEIFFGLRDFIYFLKYLRSQLFYSNSTFHLSSAVIINGIERNFNGILHDDLASLAEIVLENFDCGTNKATVQKSIDVVRCALSADSSENSRFTLIIDETEDDSIMRLLQSEKLLHISEKTLFKLSNMPNNAEMEQLQLVSGVKFAALRGAPVVLSETQSINESFYDLFNQHFRKVKNKEGILFRYANIAVGGISRRSKIDSKFRCVVHVRVTELDSLPAPFLNRFEKYRLSVHDILEQKIRNSLFLCSLVKRTKRQAMNFASSFHICGFTVGQTIDSYLIHLISDSPLIYADCTDLVSWVRPEEPTFLHFILAFVQTILKWDIGMDEIQLSVSFAKKFLPICDADVLHKYVSKESVDMHKLTDAVVEVLTTGKPALQSAILITQLVEILVSRRMTIHLLGLVSTEDIYVKRHHLPADLLKVYFKTQHHFSIRTLLENNSNKKLIIHTRSNGFISTISSIGMDNMNDISNCKNNLISDRDGLWIQHLESLQDESTIRSLLDSWCTSSCIHTLLIFIDMSFKEVVGRINFLRCYIDQRSPFSSGKTVALLLHYPASSFVTRSFYPAIFLDGWDHFYLDNLVATSSFAEYLLEKTCIPGGEDIDIGNMTQFSVDEAATFLSRQDFVYDGQVSQGSECHSNKFEFILGILNTKIKDGIDDTIFDTICKSFAQLFTENIVNSLLRRAATGIQQGTSRLGLTVCLKIILQDAMKAFLLQYFAYLNEWRNVDVLTNAKDEATIDLFYRILQLFHGPPLEELLLCRIDALVKAKELPKSTNTLSPLFPFFSFVSTNLDRIVGYTLSIIDDRDDRRSNLQYVLEVAMKNLEAALESEKDGSISYEVIQYVLSGDSCLYDNYFDQFLCWRLNSLPEMMESKWFAAKIASEMPFSCRNILAVHFCYQKFETDFARIQSLNSYHFAVSMDDLSDNNKLNLFKVKMNWFRNHISDLINPGSFGRWMHQFDIFMSNMDILLEVESYALDTSTCHILRILVFLYVVRSKYSSEPIVHGCIEDYSLSQPEKFQDYSCTTLEDFKKTIIKNVNNESEVNSIIQSLVFYFFRGSWLSNIETNVTSDLQYIISFHQNGYCEFDFESLIRNFCIHGTYFDKKYLREFDSHPLLNLSMKRINTLNQIIACENLSSFDTNGVRDRLPKFVPSFLRQVSQTDGYGIIEQESCLTFLDKYFCSHGNDFHSSLQLADAIFQVVLERLVEMYSSSSSEAILLDFLKDLEIESDLTREDQIRTRRLNSFSEMNSSLVGSALAVLLYEAKIAVFIFRVSHDFACGIEMPIYSGTYSSEAKEILERIMTLNQTDWQLLFMKNIERCSGRGKLISLLNTNVGVLSKMHWTREWSGGLPSSREIIERDIRSAELELMGVENEELRKENVVRLCPYCANPFEVSQRNCGQYICGRANFHTTPQNGPLGCGQQFNEVGAPYYTRDDKLIARLRANVEEEKRKLHRYTEMNQRWLELDSYQIPCLITELYSDRMQSLFVPSSIACNSIGDDFIEVKHVIHNMDNIKNYNSIPDMIESMVFAELMRPEILSKKYNQVELNFILQLWERVKKGVNGILKDYEFKVNWDCETITVPFNSIEESSLAMMLSAFEHPTGGCDLIFIILNQLILQFNNFMMKVHKETMPEISPRSILHQSPAALAIINLSTLSPERLSTIISNSRVTNKDAYDLEKLRAEMDRLLTSCSFLIENPMKSLRTKFHFRSSTINAICPSNECAGLRSSVGIYFVHFPDFILFERIIEIIERNSKECQNDIEYTFTNTFRDLSIEKLRGLLEGISRVLTNSSTALGAIKFEVGFTDLSDAQRNLILSLNDSEIPVLIEHLGYQLASESYHYADLPITMHSIVSKTTKLAFKQNLNRLEEIRGCSYTLKMLREFKDNILSFYQGEIRKKSSESNESMKTFLESNNFSDDDDPIFSALPGDVSVRNYVSLQQELHQLILYFMSKDSKHGINECDTCDDPTMLNQVHSSFSKPTRGNAWYWSSPTELPHLDDEQTSACDESTCELQDFHEKLWFESDKNVSKQDETGRNEVLSMDTHDSDDDSLQNSKRIAAVTIQRWLRFHHDSVPSTITGGEKISNDAISDIRHTDENSHRHQKSSNISDILSQQRDKSYDTRNTRNEKIILLLTFAALLVVQLIILFWLFFYSKKDPSTFLHKA